MTGKSQWAGKLLVGLVVAFSLVACGPKTATLSVETQDFKFVPDHWIVPAGANVTLTLTNTGAQNHTWFLMKKGITATTPFVEKDNPNVLFHGEIEAGTRPQVFTFVAPTEPGDYEVVCGTPAHLEQGMKGTLTVTQ
jgi:plastocyanin